jgi:hypothetical protein
LNGAIGGGADLRPEPSDDWSTGIETWASTAQSPPKCKVLEEGPHMSVKEAQPTSETSGARRTPTDRAVEAGERLLEASSKVGNAYADAYQEAVISMSDFREKLGDVGLVDWSKLMPSSDTASPRSFGKPLREAADTATRVNEQIVTASKTLGLAYIDACEQAVLCSVALREQAATATDNEFMQSIETTRAGVARDVTRAYLDAARRLLG